MFLVSPVCIFSKYESCVCESSAQSFVHRVDGALSLGRLLSSALFVCEHCVRRGQVCGRCVVYPNNVVERFVCIESTVR